jgi:hypothetical protein
MIGVALVASIFPNSTATPQRVPWRIVEQWTIPNGGYGRAIVIDSAHANEADLRILGDELRDLTANDRNAFIWVYSDSTAAKLRRVVGDDSISKARVDSYDRHSVGSYFRNANNGLHELTIMPEGLTGPAVKVTYPSARR